MVSGYIAGIKKYLKAQARLIKKHKLIDDELSHDMSKLKHKDRVVATFEKHELKGYDLIH